MWGISQTMKTISRGGRMEKETKSIDYFFRPGHRNTAALIDAVRRRVVELGIRHVVVATNSGRTARKFWEKLHDLDITLVAVTGHAGYSGKDALDITPEIRHDLDQKGVKILTCSHALSGVARSITNKFGGVSHVEIIAHTLRLFGEGVKVAVEVSVMAADAGLVPTDRDIIAAGGTGKGADAALVLNAAHMNNFFDLKIREVIAMWRGKQASR
jgi:uncharacterized protein